jgi:hypothetical protein
MNQLSAQQQLQRPPQNLAHGLVLRRLELGLNQLPVV